MTDSAFSSLASDYAAALDWWRDAGVDLDYADAPRGWLREPAPAAEAEQERAIPARTAPRPEAHPALQRALAQGRHAQVGGDPAHWPSDLPGFHRFWMTEPSLDDGALADRVPPAGHAGAELMVLIGMPEDGDREALLSGGCGALLTRILAAMKIAETDVYYASALPRCTQVPEWEELAPRGLAALTCHHIALAAPRRLIAFGKWPAILSEDSPVPRLAAPQLEMIGRSPPHKRRFWNAWLEWSASFAA